MTAAPLFRIAFIAYALALVTATHWPALVLGKEGGPRIDLFIHAGAFGGWALLLALCAWFGPVLSQRNILRAVGIAMAYAVLDELSQGIPVFRRSVDPLDLAANFAGVLAAGVVLLGAGRLTRSASPPDSSAPPAPDR